MSCRVQSASDVFVFHFADCRLAFSRPKRMNKKVLVYGVAILFASANTLSSAQSITS